MDLLKRRRIALAVTGVVVVVIAGYLVFWWREDHGHHPEYGDVGAWLGAAAAWLAAGGAAVAAYFAFGQLRELRGQARLQAAALDRQGEQLLAEAEARRAQAALMDEQLAQVRAANRALLRQQAEQVDVIFGTSVEPPDGLAGIGSAFHVVAVENRSKRPIRDVRAYITLIGGQGSSRASVVGTLNEVGQGKTLRQRRVNFSRQDDHQDVIRSDEAWVFVFPMTELHGARMSVEFTDDARARWTIDHQLHLEPAPNAEAE